MIKYKFCTRAKKFLNFQRKATKVNIPILFVSYCIVLIFYYKIPVILSLNSIIIISPTCTLLFLITAGLLSLININHVY